MGINLHLLNQPITHDSRVLRETRSLLASGLFDEVNVCTLEREGPCDYTDAEGRRITGIALRSRNLPRRLLPQLIKYAEWHRQVIRQFRTRPISVIHCHDWEPLPIAVHLQRLTKARIVYDAHELETASNSQTPFMSRVVGMIERRYLDRASLVLLVSEAIRQHYLATYGIRRAELVLNCPDQVVIERNRLLRDEFGIPDSATIYIYVGGLMTGRGIEMAIESFAQSDPRRRALVFMGYGPLQEQVKAAADASRAVFLKGPVPPDEVVRYVASADVGLSLVEDVSLSDRYSLPNKLFECLMAGIPVIVPNLPEMARLVTEWKCGVVMDSLTREGLDAAISRLEGLDRHLLRANAVKASGNFSWQVQEKVLVGAYREILSQPVP